MAYEEITRNVIGEMKRIHEATRPGPWRQDALVSMGMFPEDAGFVIMVHSRFPAICDQLLRHITKLEAADRPGKVEDVTPSAPADLVQTQEVSASAPPKPNKPQKAMGSK